MTTGPKGYVTTKFPQSSIVVATSNFLGISHTLYLIVHQRVAWGGPGWLRLTVRGRIIAVDSSAFHKLLGKLQ